MVKVYLDNGEVVECDASMIEATDMFLRRGATPNTFWALTKSDNEGVIFNGNKILRIEGYFTEMSDSEVDGSPYSEDIIVD